MVLLRLRVAVIGEPTSGKTAFVQMVHSNGMTFPKNYLMTMGCDFVVKDLPLDDENTVEVCLLDVAGQKLYDRFTPTYLESVSAFILVYDVTNKTNKMDLADKSEVTDNQGEIFARANQLTFFKCSALRGMGINEPIEELARLFLNGYNKRVTELAQS